MPISRQRIAFVITELEVGGAEKCLVNLATGVDPSRFEPMVISLASRPKRERLVQQLAERNVPVHFLGLGHWRQFPGGLKQLGQLLEELKPDIVQTFLFHANVLGAMAANRARIQRVFAGARVADPRWSRMAAERWALGGVNRIVCVSEAVAKRYERGGFSRDRLMVIPNGIDLSLWSGPVTPAELSAFGVGQNCRAFVYIGRLDRQKGLDVLLKALNEVFAQIADVDLLLVGEGAERDSLAQLASELGGHRERVHFVGWHPNVREILAACDLLVLPSRWEGMPNVLLEAMAAGKPVVASQVEGITELLGRDSSEQTVPAGNVESLAEWLIRLLDNADLRSRLGQRNRARVLEHFSLSAMIHKYEELYSK